MNRMATKAKRGSALRRDIDAASELEPAVDRILVAEDSRTQADWLRRVLEALGYQVEIAGDGTTALRRAREEPPALVLADVDMPGLDGFEFCRSMKADPLLRLVPFVMVTHRDRVTDLIRALEVGADNYVTKPLEAATVESRVTRILTDVGQWRRRSASQRHRLGIPPEEIILSLERGQLVEMLMAAAQKLQGELATVAEIGLGVTMIDQLDELLSLLVRRTRELAEAAAVAVFLHEGGEWSLGSVDAADEALDTGMRLIAANQRQPPGMAERLLQRRPAHLKKGTWASVLTEQLSTLGLRETYAYPMLAGDELMGALLVSFAQPRRLAADEQRRYEVLANHGAVAVVNARNLEAERKLRRELEAAMQAEHEAHKNAMFMLAAAVEARDGLTGSHLHRVQRYAEAIGREVGLGEEVLDELSYSSVMHDVGKLLVADAVLGKPGKLSEEEWVQMRRHPEYGAQILGDREFFRTARQIALCHHERWDGTGYPRGLKADAIPLAARITSVADVFDALTTKRPYKEAWTDEAALAELRAQAGRSFDPQIVAIFMALYEAGVIDRVRAGIANHSSS
jgi:response regulator RpfG family c-di-GMP phosphodiesterase